MSNEVNPGTAQRRGRDRAHFSDRCALNVAEIRAAPDNADRRAASVALCARQAIALSSAPMRDDPDDRRYPAPLPAWRSDNQAWHLADDGRFRAIAPIEDLCADVELLREDSREVRRSTRDTHAEAVRLVEASRRQRLRLAKPLRLIEST